jgi:undecaprenyl phosphate-alpha-L-ara4N flippase subunit ArnE
LLVGECPCGGLGKKLQTITAHVAKYARITDHARTTNMTLEALIFIAVSVACDVFGQTFFKLGAIASSTQWLPARLWVAIGLIVYGIEIFVWLHVLAITPLTIAAPLASLNYIGVMLASWWLFGERIVARQWAGAGIVTLGVIAVSLTGG